MLLQQLPPMMLSSRQYPGNVSGCSRSINGILNTVLKRERNHCFILDSRKRINRARNRYSWYAKSYSRHLGTFVRGLRSYVTS